MENIDFDLLDILQEASKNKKKTAIIVIAVLGLIAIASGAFGEFIMVLLILAEIVVSFFVGEFGLKKFGIELATFVTVITGFVYGPWTGASMGVLMMIIHFVLSMSLGPYVVYCTPIMGLIGYAAGYVGLNTWLGGNITMLGILLSISYNLITGSIGTFLFNDFFEELTWSGSNVMINCILFSRFAPLILTAMGV